ncbi:MAG: hypothetical protein KDI61_11715 [Alphaproteobacteria bacterium]|nr:hypothetical protein [Alphaproteobacteria bacterium]
MTLFFISLITSSLSACSAVPTPPSAFTNENIMKVHQGMISDDILTLFGKPQNIDVAVCGMPPNQWNCTTWKYEGFFDERASFTFSGEHDSLILNNFNVDRN